MKWVTIKKAAELSGYSAKAIEHKRERGVWVQGDIWIKAPDGRIPISIEGIERWAEGQVFVPQLRLDEIMNDPLFKAMNRERSASRETG
jgi:hypothetical protein